jgi:hypothetical protein
MMDTDSDSSVPSPPPSPRTLLVARSAEGTSNLNTIVLSRPYSFTVPPQKKPTLVDVGPDEPILLASNDPTFLPGKGSIRDKIREQHEKRGKDSSPWTNPGGDYIPMRIVATATRPDFKMDHGFLDDGNGNIDNSKRRSATAKDWVQKAKWAAMLTGAEMLRWDLDDATRMYRHFLENTGSAMTFSYEKFARDDRTGAQIIDSAIEDVRAGAIELADPRGGSTFTIQSDVIGAGASDENGDLINPRYGYPGTENWQKAIGAHSVWLEATVQIGVDAATKRQRLTIDMTLHAEDRYNFNPGNQDISTGIADAENGRFEVTGLAREFDTSATLQRHFTFTVPDGGFPNLRAKPADQVVSAPARQ